MQGVDVNHDGKLVRVIDGRPETIRATCEAALKRLKTEVIDLYYLHRWDKQVPVEDSVGALSDLVRAGKVQTLGLSEVSAATLRRAHRVHPIAAVQTEYSLWTRNPEIAVLKACEQLNVAFVAFSPLARGFLCGEMDVTAFDAKDIRRAMPRFAPANYAENAKLLPGFLAIAREVGCTPSQLAIAWLLHRGKHILPIPRHHECEPPEGRPGCRGRDAQRRPDGPAGRPHQPAHGAWRALQRAGQQRGGYGSVLTLPGQRDRLLGRGHAANTGGAPPRMT